MKQFSFDTIFILFSPDSQSKKKPESLISNCYYYSQIENIWLTIEKNGTTYGITYKILPCFVLCHNHIFAFFLLIHFTFSHLILHFEKFFFLFFSFNFSLIQITEWWMSIGAFFRLILILKCMKHYIYIFRLEILTIHNALLSESWISFTHCGICHRRCHSFCWKVRSWLWW